MIVGAGPAGRCCARARADTPFRGLLVEQQPRASLAAAPFDGREIALTHRSSARMRRRDIWERIPASDISSPRDTKALNGPSHDATQITHEDGRRDQLGHPLPNHPMRRAAELLSKYARDLRIVTRPLYLTTRLIATLYANDSLPGRFLRNTALRIGNRFTPFRRSLADSITDAG